MLTLLLYTSLFGGLNRIEADSTNFQAVIRGGAVTSLRTADGTQLVQTPDDVRGVSVHRVSSDHWGADAQLPAGQTGPLRLDREHPQTELTSSFTGLSTGQVRGEYRIDPDCGELVIRHELKSAPEGVWGISWWIADIPLEYAILVPGTSGVRLTAETPQAIHQFDYPMMWEVQLVIVEGPSGGFWVWAEDPDPRFKRLVVERRRSGWRLGFYTLNEAPFDHHATCQSVTWRLNTYTGDWRVPARRYRDWFQHHAAPVPIAEQRPNWVKDIRSCVIMPTDIRTLEPLARQFDPEQTLIYLYDWRQPGYDRDYPDYEKIRPDLIPFVERAHQLKFRVMLHVNYFGVDPRHPLYAQFEPYQVRSPWGQHEKEWWVWPIDKPDIRFAYINPACSAWRDLFTRLMVRLCQQTGTDALHLDQTLCIYNDNNGRIDGMSMAEGNVALHRQLRAALPDIALSGEGLNEITCRYESFTQRHVWGVDHTKGTYDRRMLAAAHPISSYILRPYTVIYGYLGCAPPEDDQLYAAWQEAYRHWGVIPTLKPSGPFFTQPGGFSRQFLDELHFWQTNRVENDFDGVWPADVVLPMRTADGRPVLALQDGRTVCQEQVISRTITGVSQAEGSGTIPNWPAFDRQHLLGLDPQHWYPYFDEPRDDSSLHVCELPADLTLDYLYTSETLTMLSLRDATPVLQDLALLLGQAEIGSRTGNRPPQTLSGPGESSDGSAFTSFADMISAHPPWKQGANGEAFARFHWKVPQVNAVPQENAICFVSDVALDPAAVGDNRSDGVTFIVRAEDGPLQLSNQIHQPTDKPARLQLDLTPLAGRDIILELAVHPGPQNNPSYDWARWRQPRIERDVHTQATIGILGGPPWHIALAGTQIEPITQHDQVQLITLTTPGTACLLRSEPPPVQLPVTLERDPDQMFVVLDSGRVASAAQFATVKPSVNVVGGVSKSGLLQHPPNHGRTMAAYLMRLPEQPARFTASIGLRDGSKSDGVRFRVEVNGSQLADHLITPGVWHPVEADLSLWAGKPIVLSLVTDSEGSHQFDWAVWGQPQITANP